MTAQLSAIVSVTVVVLTEFAHCQLRAHKLVHIMQTAMVRAPFREVLVQHLERGASPCLIGRCCFYAYLC